MEPIILLAAIISIIGGILDGLDKCNKCKTHPELGVKPSKNLLTFLFID
jgi:hypothetical protein